MDHPYRVIPYGSDRRTRTRAIQYGQPPLPRVCRDGTEGCSREHRCHHSCVETGTRLVGCGGPRVRSLPASCPVDHQL